MIFTMIILEKIGNTVFLFRKQQCLNVKYWPVPTFYAWPDPTIYVRGPKDTEMCRLTDGQTDGRTYTHYQENLIIRASNIHVIWKYNIK